MGVVGTTAIGGDIVNVCSCVHSSLYLAVYRLLGRLLSVLAITFITFRKYPILVFYVTENESFHLFLDKRPQYT